jgi:hypothetical protein
MATSKLLQLAIAKLSETKEEKVVRELSTTLKFMVTDCNKVISAIKGTINTLNDELQAAEDYYNDAVQELNEVIQTIPDGDRKSAYKVYVGRREHVQTVVIEREK